VEKSSEERNLVRERRRESRSFDLLWKNGNFDEISDAERDWRKVRICALMKTSKELSFLVPKFWRN